MTQLKAFRVTCKTALLAILFCASAAAQATTSTSTQTAGGQPSNNPGLVSGLLSATGLGTSNTIGATVGSIAGGGGAGSGLTLAGMPPGTSRFALPGQGDTGAAAAPGGKSANAWIALSHNNVGYSFAPLQSSGGVNVGIIGADYTFSNKVVLGVAVAFDRTDINLTFNGGKLKGSGSTISPYIGIPLNKQWTADGSFGVGRTKINTDMLGVTGATNDDRTVGNLGLTYRRMADKWMLSGRGAYLAVRDKLGSYTLSDGNLIQESTTNVSQIRLGAQAAYNAGSVVPHFGLQYIYDVTRPKQDPLSGQTAANDRDAFQGVIGLQFMSKGALYGGVQFSSEFSRKEVKNDQFLLNIGARF